MVSTKIESKENLLYTSSMYDLYHLLFQYKEQNISSIRIILQLPKFWNSHALEALCVYHIEVKMQSKLKILELKG